MIFASTSSRLFFAAQGAGQNICHKFLPKTTTSHMRQLVRNIFICNGCMSKMLDLWTFAICDDLKNRAELYFNAYTLMEFFIYITFNCNKVFSHIFIRNFGIKNRRNI